MLLRYFQKGFNYSQDGHGNRLIYHLQGCNMKCPWCSNPEGMRMQGVLMTDPEWLAPDCCPKGAIRETQPENPSKKGRDKDPQKETVLALDRSVCEKCTDKPCVFGRRQKGLRWSCTELDTSKIVSECASSRPMFFDGGGVTLTGGEMSLQFDAVKELLGLLGYEKIHRTVETNGSHPEARKLVPLVDEWIMDLKHTDNRKHKEWLGIGNEQIKKTLSYVTGHHNDVLIRIPLMPGFNDSPGDADDFAEYLAPYAGGKNKDRVRVEVLTYHEFGRSKWSRCGMEYRMQGRISPEQRKSLEDRLKKAGLQVVRT